MFFCLLFLSVISTLPTTSYSLTCIECSGIAEFDIGIPCTGIVKTCSSNEVCVSKHSVIIIGGLQQPGTYGRTCGQRELCSASISASAPYGRIMMSFSCCDTDRCTPPRPELPSISSEKNGVVCKTCQSKENVPCDSKTYMDCVGEETKCFSQVTRSGSQGVAERGCATPSLCAIPHNEGSFGNLDFKVDTTCTDGGAGLHYRLHLLPITFICLFKVMS
ncbi:phospholipase A2 inhibitor and Ly6/PLAUR domain-containing protein-like [Bufo gargarizans]|uniref:phospholipase A2 inhibitor and Ly6/PLAUR domain-containing protein-like n=1 Tax=Bufo gargarizans TaxID=30331 RepID=UPI001CF2D74E|nr:phospholipase A2 inhibitor and Ly6/PLAUR domain-containing protein-like [Bufo gargarizans]